MHTDVQLFLLAAEDLNFTRAAKRAHVTQQCLSAHIRKLEKNYQTRLFERSPHLALTPAGEVLYRSLRKIQIIERSTRENISGIREGIRGKVTMGINASRVQLLLPKLYRQYHKEFPNVILSVVLDDVRNQVEKLLNGNIDLLVGVNCPLQWDLVSTPLAEESVFFLATDTFLQQHAKKAGAYPRTLRTGTIDMAEYTSLPLVQNAEASTIVTVVERYCQAHNLLQDTLIQVSDSQTQIRLCGTGLVGMYLAESLLSMPREYNRLHPEEESLRILRPKGMNETLHFAMVTHRNATQPFYIRRLQEMLKNLVKKEIDSHEER
jgi:DNA-binding transcriptional LysR family regulator